MTHVNEMLLKRAGARLLECDISPDEFAERVRAIIALMNYHGARYRHTGRTRVGGVDCATLLLCGFGDAGLVDGAAELPPYPRDFHQHRSEELYLNVIEKFAHRVQRDAIPGDIALFKIGRVVSHSAVVLDWPLGLHAWSISGVVETVDVIAAPELGLKRFAGLWSVWR